MPDKRTNGPPPPAVKSDADFRFDEGRVYYTAQVGLELPVTVPIPFSTLKYMCGHLLMTEAGHVYAGSSPAGESGAAKGKVLDFPHDS